MEIVGRGSADTYHPILYQRFNKIGAASNALEGLMALDQFDTAHTTLHSYDDTHPIPSNKEILIANFHRYQPNERLNACAKI